MNVFLKKLLLYIPVKMVPAVAGVFFVVFLYKFFPEGQYVSYSVSIFCALTAAQLCSGWVGNSFIYHYSGVEDKARFLVNCLGVVLVIAPIASLLAATTAVAVIDESSLFIYVWMLCFSQIVFFFLSSVCQGIYLVKQQLIAVLLQAFLQIGWVIIFFQFWKIDFRYALLASAVGYAAAASFMLFSTLRLLSLSGPFWNTCLFRGDLHRIYAYGAALSPWMLGMLVMAGSDRLLIGLYEIEHGDSYLSLKDLFIGGAGLLSMPLLMMVHPFVINKFRAGTFAIGIIESSSSFLLVAFSLLWSVIYFVGLDFFERITGKGIGAPHAVIFFAFVGVYISSAAVYFQKRLEVHRKMRLLAYLSLICAAMSFFFSWVGGMLWGLYGISLGVLLAQVLYLIAVVGSMSKRLDFYKSFALPAMVSFFAYSAGYLLNVIVQFIETDIWWMRSILWLSGFTMVSLISFWKGVRWREFLNATTL
jgi:hypothetical protein